MKSIDALRALVVSSLIAVVACAGVVSARAQAVSDQRTAAPITSPAPLAAAPVARTDGGGQIFTLSGGWHVLWRVLSVVASMAVAIVIWRIYPRIFQARHELYTASVWERFKKRLGLAIGSGILCQLLLWNIGG